MSTPEGAGRAVGRATANLLKTQERIAGRAAAWLVANLKHFDPLTVVETERHFANKAFIELAVLVAYKHRLGPEPPDESYAVLRRHIESYAARPAYYGMVARDHGGLLLYGMTYAALRACGGEYPKYRQVIERSIATRHALVAERIPYRQLDLLHFLHLAGFEHPAGTTFEDVLPYTILAGRPNVVEVSETDVYAITHTIFYVTDFGLRTSTWSESFDMEDALELLESLLRHFRHRGNADLVAELIASCLCLGVLSSPEVDLAWQFLDAQQEPDGRLPGPPGVIDEAQTAAEFGAAYCAWKTSYHTTAITALAALMARRAAEGTGYPAKQLPGGPGVRSSSARG